MDFAELFWKTANKSIRTGSTSSMSWPFSAAITTKNWAWTVAWPVMTTPSDCPFFQRVCFEDYIYRLWIRKRALPPPTSTRAEPYAFQLHAEPRVRRDLQRGSVEPAQEKDQSLGLQGGRAGVSFDYEGEVAEDATLILDKVASMHAGAGGAERAVRRRSVAAVRGQSSEILYGFEPDFFSRTCCIVDDVVNTIKGSIELWPTLIEICYFEKNAGTSRVKVNNRRRAG